MQAREARPEGAPPRPIGVPAIVGPIRFLFDYISPYAYLAWTQLHALAERNHAAVEPVPVLFAGLLNAHGQKGPAEIPPKKIYIFKDVLRRAHGLGVPLASPPSHPFNPLLALRASSLPMAPEARRALIDGLFRATWGGGPGITAPAQIAAIATGAGLDGPRLVAAAETPEIKAQLRRQTDDAIAAGVFGVPTFFVGDELFWGFDALEFVERCLRGEDPIDRELVARWSAIQPTASRTT